MRIVPSPAVLATMNPSSEDGSRLSAVAVAERFEAADAGRLLASLVLLPLWPRLVLPMVSLLEALVSDWMAREVTGAVWPCRGQDCCKRRYVLHRASVSTVRDSNQESERVRAEPYR